MYKLIMEKNPKMDDGWTPLHLAAKYGCKEIFEMILNEVEHKHPQMVNGTTPCHLAIQNGHEEIFEMIMNNVQGFYDVLHSICSSKDFTYSYSLRKVQIYSEPILKVYQLPRLI